MKEIQKVVQKLSREQESAAGGGAGGGARTGIPGWLNNDENMSYPKSAEQATFEWISPLPFYCVGTSEYMCTGIF